MRSSRLPGLIRAAERDASRIWRDLKTYRSHTTAVEVGRRETMADKTPSGSGDRLGKRRAAALRRVPHVGVIGAGLAGLRCADILLRNGFRVTILEGRNRVGGRVHQQKLPSGHLVDAGPNWIHGTVNNPILNIAKQTGTAIGTWDLSTCTIDGEGCMMPQAESEALSTHMWDIIESAFRYSNENCAAINPGRSLWDYFLEEVPKRIPETEAGWEAKRSTVLQMAKSWGCFVGSHIETQSLKFFWLEECLEGENLFCAGTYKNILEVVAKRAMESAQIKFETTVAKIQCTSDEGGTLQVEDQSGGYEEFDEVVMTAPLGWLKRHPEAFIPALPPRLGKAIANIGYGCLEKVYINFPRAYWLGTGGAEGEGGGTKAQGFCKWLAPRYAADTNPRGWEQEAVELASLTCHSAHATLLFYMYGDQSRHLAAALAAVADTPPASASSSSSRSSEPEPPEGGREEREQALLREWFAPYYTRLPNYSASDAGCRPAGCYATRWGADELAGRGSYSNFQVGLEEGDADIEAMRRGAPDRGLWLAGEHTAPFVALGTATGAYWSGEAVARRLAAAYGREQA